MVCKARQPAAVVRPRAVFGGRRWPAWLCLLLVSLVAMGCRRTASMHVWHPPQSRLPSAGRVALAPIAGDRQLAERLEQALLAQLPPARGPMVVLTPPQLLESSAVQLASTAALTSDVLSLQAARNLDADVLLQGEILDADIDLHSPPPAQEKQIDWNQAFFRKRKSEDKREKILMSWRVIDVASSRTIATSNFNLATAQAIKQYPDLHALESDQTQLLIAASARESWKTVAPYVAKDQVRLAVPWLQPGSFVVRRGVAAARQGNWQLAEQRWQWVSNVFWFNAAARHNLALAYAAREDFPAAKAELQKATGPLAVRLPSETLMWLDRQHRNHNQALGLGRPAEGWSFPDPDPTAPLKPAPAVDVAMLPWWTALPLAKPPGWTWQGWLTQPWVF